MEVKTRRLQLLQQSFVDVVKTAVGHHQDQITAAGLGY